MSISSIYYTSNFEKHFKKLPISIKRKAIFKEKLFRKDPMHADLKTHALSGRLKGYHSFAITHHYRIMFKFEKDGSVTFIDTGTHSIYR